VDGIPLTREDRAILDLETASVAGHTCKVVLLDDPAPGLDELRASVAARLASEPALRWRLGGPPDAPEWVDDERFDIAAHVVDTEADPCDEAALRREVARLFADRLDRSRPLWRIDLVARASGAALVWRIHHALADGTVAMRFADSVLWDVAPAAAGRRHAHAESPHRHARLAAFLRHEVALGPERSPFDGEIGSAREVAFASAPLRELHDAAKRLSGATLNDAVLTAVAGGVREWIEHHHGRLGHVRVKVPVSLHHPGDDAGNRDSFFTLELPLGEPDPVARLEAVRAATRARKEDHDAETLDELMRDLARVSPGLERLCRRFEASPRAFALNVSNVPGPSGAMAVLEAPVQAVYSIAEIGRRHALRVAVVSAGGRLQFGFCADPEIVDGLSLLAGAVEADAAALVDAAG
jgi:hypothetical protein